MEQYTPLSHVFKKVSNFINDDIFAIETGISSAFYPENMSNLSTVNIRKFLLSTKKSFLISIDIDSGVIDACKRHMGKDFSQIIPICGDSVSIMRERLLPSGKKFNFFWLDSCEDMIHGEEEYLLSLQLAKYPFVICIDDYKADGSVKWRKSAQLLKQDASFWEEEKTATGLIVGYFKGI